MKNRIRPLIDYQIEQILLTAHKEEEDLITNYFSIQSSLDSITEKAAQLLKETNNPKIQEAIRKNLSECIVVKSQREKGSLFGYMKRGLSKMGLNLPKSREIVRAEKVIQAKS